MVIKLIAFLVSVPMLAFSMGRSSLSEREQESHKTISQFAKHVEKERSLKLAGAGGAQKNGKTRWFELVFQTPQYLCIDEARVVVMELAKEFKENVDANDSLTQFLPISPCPNECVKIRVITTADAKIPDGEYLRSFGFDKGEIVFFYENTERDPKWEVESLEEAKAKIASAR